ncbi:MAG: tetratricopeptide repeat protein [Verrucomicrobiae bacterium]|nr:tetratricopeptide repeat protein [Verrucomicrobiae bacterium]
MPAPPSAQQQAAPSPEPPTSQYIPPSMPVEGSDAKADLKLKPDAVKRAEAMARCAAGKHYELRQQFDKALQEYQAAFDIDPTAKYLPLNAGMNHVPLAVHLGAEYLRRKQNDKAQAVLERAAAVSPTSYEIHLLLGIAYQSAGKTPKAIAAYQEASRIDPLQIAPYQSLAAVYLKEHKAAETLRVLERAFQQNSEDARFWATLGDLYALTMSEPTAAKAVATVYTQKPKSPRAVECYEKARKFAPEDLGILFRLGGYYVAHNEADKGIALYQHILEKRPDALDVRERLADAYAAKKDFDRGAAQIEEVIKRQPTNWRWYDKLGGLYEAGKAYDRAQANYEQALILNPKELTTYLRLTRLYLVQKRQSEALQILQRAKERFPDSARVPYFLGLVCSSMKDYPKAIEAFVQTEIMAKGSQEEKDILDTTFYFYYGAACERGGQFERAVELFRKSLKLNPDNDESCNYLGYMFADKGENLKEAEMLIKRALKAEPKNGAYLDSLGWVYFRLGRTYEALRYLNEAAKTDAAKEDAAIFEHLAEVYLKMGRKDLAREHLQKGLQVEPGNKKIAEKLKALETGASAKPTPIKKPASVGSPKPSK